MQIPDLIYKYLNNQTTEVEVEKLFDWIEASEENKQLFIGIKKTWVLATLPGNNPSEVIQLNKKKRKTITLLKYAAVFVILLGLGKLAFDYSKKPQSENEIILELRDGRIEYVSKQNQTNLLDENGKLIAEKKEDQIVYHGKVNDDKVNYNTLTVPYGKTFIVVLSDGTKVTINSGTTLRYPEQFGIHSNRQVYLSGEAFFEVSKDKKHPFIVNSNEVDVRVLGTKFNVSAYPEEATVTSTLVEGSIQLEEDANKSNSVVIVPNQMAVWNKKTKNIAVANVDPSLYTAWLNGEMVFKDTPFSVIAKIIERTYNVEIINKSSELAKQRFSGTISTKESSVENILELLKRDTAFQYSKDNNTITITNIP